MSYESGVTLINLGKMRELGMECDEQSLIHREQLNRVCSIISKRIDEALCYNPEKCFIQINDIISIFARRGAGKTTFVKTLIKLIKAGDLCNRGIKPCDLMCIDVIEPNQMHKKENFMIRFIASIQEQFEKDVECPCKKEDLCLKKVKDNLYEALPVIDGIGKLSLYSDWDDSDYLADKYIQLATKVKDLEHRFHTYIHEILKLSGKKALLFILDDSDVNIERTFDILETIRLFFTSPQIIVVMTGDLSLYSMAIRKNYWKFFDIGFIEKDSLSIGFESVNQTEYYNMVRQLEAQYLQKLIKAEHRIVLNTVYEKYKNAANYPQKQEYSIQIRFSSDSETTKGKDLREIYEDILGEVKMAPKDDGVGDMRFFVDHLLKQPFRNQYRLLSAYDEYLAIKNGRIANAVDYMPNLSEVVLKVFEVYINQYSLDNKKLMNRSPIYSGWLMKFMIDNEVATTATHLLPTIAEDTLNNALFALNVWCESQIQTEKSIAFDYLVRVSFVRQILLMLNEDGKDMDDFVGICRDIDVHKILGCLHAYFNAKKHVTKCDTNGNDFQYPFSGVFVLESYAFPKTSGIEGDLVDLIQLISLSANMTKSYMCSFYKLVAALAELLRENGERKNYLKKAKNDSNWIAVRLNDISQYHTYMEPNEESYQCESERKDIHITTRFNKGDEKKQSIFIGKLSKWIEDVNFTWITPHSLDRIFTRLYFSLTEIDSKIDRGFENIGDRFSDYVLAFWNACIVEECIVNNKNKEITLGYTAHMADVFIENYRRFTKMTRAENTAQSFAISLINCPLLRAYVNPRVLVMIGDEKIQVEEHFALRATENNEVLGNRILETEECMVHVGEERNTYLMELRKWDDVEKLKRRKEHIEGQLPKCPSDSATSKELSKELNDINNSIFAIVESLDKNKEEIYEMLNEVKRTLNNLKEQKQQMEERKRQVVIAVDENTINKIKGKFEKALNNFNELSVYENLKEWQL